MLLRTRLSLVGKKPLQAFQTKCLAFPSTCKWQFFFTSYCNGRIRCGGT
uniref:Uncharacterized protein n=1 Tax=Rhizophora mucronata TaxID=61149 RepID=A0A2P2IZW6_RHIMU